MTSELQSDLAALKEALAAGPTPGPWNKATDWSRAAVMQSLPPHKRVVCTGNQNNADRWEVADWSGATWVDADYIAAASPDRIQRLIEHVEKLQAEVQRLTAENVTMVKAAAWVVGKGVGLSSKAIFAHMLGVEPRDNDWSHPRDPSDLGRCLQLLERMPEWKQRIPEMAGRSRYWAALVARWDEVSQCMEDEVGIDWSKGREARRTYALMSEILDAAMAAQPGGER